MKNSVTIPIKIVVAIAAILFLCPDSFTQHQPYFISSTETDGLSDDRITCFFKDRKGYVWIGTENGLNRFDGVNYKIYRPSAVKKNYLSNAFITSISQDKKGDIWVCTRSGINRIDAETDSTEVLMPPINEKSEGLPNNLNWDIFHDSDSCIWIASDSKAFVKYNPVSKKFYYYDFKKFLKEDNIAFTSQYHSIFKILPAPNNELWLATTDGIFSFNKSSGKFKMLHGTRIDKITFFFYNEKTKKIYCTDESDRLHILNTITGAVKQVATNAELYSNKTLPPYKLLYNNMFIPSHSGLLLINEKDEVTASVKNSITNAGKSILEDITTIYTDKEGITWAGTLKGAYRFVPQLNANLHVSFINSLVYHDEQVARLFQYSTSEHTWFVSDFSANKTWKINDSTGTLSEFNKPQKYQQDTFYAMHFRGEDTVIFIGKGCIFIHQASSNQWQKITLPPSWRSFVPACLTIDGDGNLWMGSGGKGLIVYDKLLKQIEPPATNKLNAYLINALFYDIKRNRVWIGTHNTGIYYYDAASAIYRAAESNERTDGELYSSLINDITMDANSNVWYTTLEAGIATYTDEKPRFSKHYGSHNEMPDNNVYGVAASARSGIYFTTGKGIGNINPSGELKTFFNKDYGLPYSKFNQAIAIADDYKVATVVNNHFFCFDTKAVSSAGKNNIIISDISLNDTGKFFLSDSKKFSYKKNTIGFSFVLPDFISAQGITYYYKLEGFDKDWIFNDRQQTARYASLPDGQYTFKVKAKRHNGDWAANEAAWSFEITPPFWKTWWFIALVTAALAGMIMLFIKKREKAIKKNAAEKSRVQQQIAELEIKALRSQMNPHFVFNSLNSISMLIAGRQNEKGLEYLNKFSKFLRLVLDESENNFIVLKDEIKLLDLYLQLESLRFGDSFSYNINIDNAIDEEDTMLPSFLVQPLTENAIWHGLLHKNGERRLIIGFEKNGEDILRCTIKDNGIGIVEAAKLKEKRLNGSIQKPKGLQMLKDRLMLLDRQFGTHTKLTIEDMKEESGLVSGTKVTIELPVKYE